MAFTEAERVLMRLLYTALNELATRVDTTELADGSSLHTYQAHAALEAVAAYDKDLEPREPPTWHMPARYRYLHDAAFHHLVDVMHKELIDLHFTPTEMREAVMLAAQMLEVNRPQPIGIMRVDDGGSLEGSTEKDHRL